MVTEPVGLSANLPNQRVMQARIGDVDIAVWRSATGKLAAWLNRCPHRGMRLSHGFVRGESLACLYHGWHYGQDTVCNYIPAHPDLEPPKTIQTTSYSILEADGVLWVSTEKSMDVPTLPKNAQPVRSITFAASRHNVQQALSDTMMTNEYGSEWSVGDDSTDPDFMTWTDKDHDRMVVILFQFSIENKVIAHILTAGDWSVDANIAVSRWSEAARRYAEQLEFDPTNIIPGGR